MNSFIRMSVAAVIACAPFAGQAATVDGGSFGAGATGERTYNSTFNSVATQFFDVQATGTLDTFTMWINTTSNFLGLGENLVYVLLGKGSGPGFPTVGDELARTSILNTTLAGCPTITGADGDSYVAATWDLSGLGISAASGEQFGIRVFPTGPSGQVKFNGTSCNGGPGTLACDPSLALSRFQGSQTSIGNSGNPVNVATYALTIDDGVTPPGPSPVPLPAGMPLLLIGFAALGIVKRRRS